MSDVRRFIEVDGNAVRALRLQVSAVGPWVAEVELAEAAALSGKVRLVVGDTELHGTVIEEQTGSFATQTSARIVGGAGGWSQQLRAKGYHNDAGIKARLIAEDAAREVGETLQSFAPLADRVGIDYAREAVTASTVLEYAAGGAGWWVDYNGLTYVGTRPTSELPSSTYQLMSLNARERIAELSLEDISALQVGSIITDDRLDSPQIVHDFEVSTTDGSPLHASVWFGGAENEAGRLASLLRSIISHATAGELPGCYRYRVVTMNADGRVDLQAVRKQSGLPDLRSTSQWPGVPGVNAVLTLGAEVVVMFVDADPAQPIITNYVGPGGGGFVPVSLAFCGSEQAAARQGDLVQSGGTGTVVTFAPVGSPTPSMLPGVPYLISFSSVPPVPGLAAPLYGAISTGSPKVKV